MDAKDLPRGRARMNEYIYADPIQFEVSVTNAVMSVTNAFALSDL